MAKKKRSKAQKAATEKMQKAAKAKRRAEKRGKTKSPRKPSRSSSAKKTKSKAKKSHPKKKGRSKKSLAAKKAAKTRAENKAARSAAAKKGAKTRKRNEGKSHPKKKAKSHPKKKKATAKARSKKKGAKKKAKSRGGFQGFQKIGKKKKGHPKGWAHPPGYAHEAAESRKGRKKHRRVKRNPLAKYNPIPLEGGLDFFSGLFAVTIGYLFAAGADRMGSTHALTASSAQGGFVDAPAAGQIYDSESPQTPIWSSGMRVAYNALAIAVPMGLSAFIKSKGPKSFFQLMAFAAAARTLGKAAEDGMSLAMKSTSFGLRLYAPELAAQAKLAQATTAALPSAAPGTFAGAPKQQALNGSPVGGNTQAVKQNNAPPPAPAFDAPRREVAGAPQQTPSLDVGPGYVSRPPFNPFAATES